MTFSYPCHSAALVTRAASAEIPEYCEKFLEQISNYIKYSPKRLTFFSDFSDCFGNKHRKILKLCETRWLSHYLCIERILELWEAIHNSLIDSTVNGKCKSAANLLDLFENPCLRAFYSFLKYVLNFFNSFSAFFQSSATKIHLLHIKSVEFFINIIKIFLSSQAMSQTIDKIDFQDHNNHRAIDDVILRAECEVHLNSLGEIGDENVKFVREKCLKFYITAAEEIRKKFLLPPFVHI